MHRVQRGRKPTIYFQRHPIRRLCGQGNNQEGVIGSRRETVHAGTDLAKASIDLNDMN